jgi:protein ImuA
MSPLACNRLPLSANSLVAQMPHALWRANQMASGHALAIPSGHARLNTELPDGGWPASTLIELLLQQSGIGEMQLLRPALAAIAAKRQVVLIHPPHLPQAAAWCSWGLPHERLLWIKTSRNADALWSAEQVLRNGSCGALLIWQPHIRSEALRRLHLAAQSAQTVMWMLRPLAQAQDSSPAPLRLGLRPASGAIEISIVKRRGPQRDAPFLLPLADLPRAPLVSTVHHAPVDRLVPAATAPRKFSTVLV